MRRTGLSLLAMAFCGVFLALPFRGQFPWPAWFALAPVFWLVTRESSRRAALGYAAVFAVVWTGFALTFIWAAAPAGMIAAALYTAAYYVVGLMLIRRIARWGLWSAVFGTAALWTIIELLRVRIPIFGFPWLLLGHTCLPFTYLRQFADVAGVFGLSFLMAAVNAAFAFALPALLRATWSALPRTVPGNPKIVFVVVGALLAGIWDYGLLRCTELKPLLEKGAPIGVIQGNIAQKLDRTDAEIAAQLKRHLELQREVVALGRSRGEPPVLVCWAETMFPGYLNDTDEDLTREFLASVRAYGVPTLCGSSYLLSPDAQARDANAVFLMNADGAEACHYFKRRLVPFGEYIPLTKRFPVLRCLRSVTRDQYEPGVLPSPVREVGGYRMAFCLCVEDVYPELARESAAAGANCLINLTNDGWFYRTCGPWAHLQAAAWRAIEVRRPMLRVTNTGFTAVVDPLGNIQIPIPEETEGVALVRLPMLSIADSGKLWTWSMRAGEGMIFCAMVALLSGLYYFSRKTLKKIVPRSNAG